MIYLDNFATTPIDPLVQQDMVACMQDTWGNPHSVTHAVGWQSGDMVDECRRDIARLLGAKPYEVVFTSGATEANNTVIKSMLNMGKDHIHKRKIVISAIEHPCIRQSAYYMQKFGYKVQQIPVHDTGIIDMQAYQNILDNTTSLVSVMLVNNELGTIQDIKTMAHMAQQTGAMFHTDSAQAVGKIPVSFKDLGVDFMSISGHKIYGPKGIGVLFVKQGVSITPLLHGGGQQRGMRSGTVPTPLVKGLATALHLSVISVDKDKQNIYQMRTTLECMICDSVSDVHILGGNADRVAGATNLYIPDVQADDFFTHLQGVCVSTGSACASAGKGTSAVMQAIGIPADPPAVAIRICIGRMNTPHEIEQAGHAIINAIKKCR